MKKIIIAAALFFASGSLTVKAGENKWGPHEVIKTISSRISVPEQLKKPDFKEYVLVSLSIDTSGKVMVLASNSGNELLRKHVEQQLSRMSFKGKLSPGQVYNFRLDFKVL